MSKTRQIYIDETIHKKLRLFCGINDRTLGEVSNKAIDDYLTRATSKSDQAAKLREIMEGK